MLFTGKLYVVTLWNITSTVNCHKRKCDSKSFASSLYIIAIVVQ